MHYPTSARDIWVQLKSLKTDISLMPHKVLVLSYPTQPQLMYAMCRLTEFMDSPEFAGKSFTREEFIKQYVPKRGKDYYHDWNGVNLPESVLADFYNNNPPLDAAESLVYDLLKTYRAHDIVGVHFQHPDIHGVIEHEMAHAAYSCNAGYRGLADSITHKPVYEEYIQYLQEQGYGAQVAYDECQAYIVSPSKAIKAPPENTEHRDTLQYVLSNIILS